MRVAYHDFEENTFSFGDDPVLVLHNFWSPEEMVQLREAMQRCKEWTALTDMPDTASTFGHCGNWVKAIIEDPEMEYIGKRLLLPCVKSYVQSFENVRARHMTFEYYSYGAGDCLSMHDDTDEADTTEDAWRLSLKRRLAVATYLHDAWDPNWGGELITYGWERDKRGDRSLVVEHCIPPLPGSVAIFAVPRFHRVARVDPMAGRHRRLSVAGWFLTEH